METERTYTFNDLVPLTKGGYYGLLGHLSLEYRLSSEEAERNVYGQDVHDRLVEREAMRAESFARDSAASKRSWERRRQGLPPTSKEPKEYVKVAGFVYILECAGVYKIGKAQNVKERMGQLGIVLPHEVHLVHTIRSDNYTKAERFLHVAYRHRHQRGEWFALTGDDLKALTQIGKIN